MSRTSKGFKGLIAAGASLAVLAGTLPAAAQDYRYAPPPTVAERALRKAERAQILEALAQAPSHGLPAVRLSRNPTDAELERAVFDYAAALRGQRLNGQFLGDWTIRPARYDAAAAYREAVARRQLGRWLDGLAPRHAAYQDLRGALARYREIEAGGGWQKLTGVLKPGARGPAVLALRSRLAMETGRGHDALDPMEFDQALAETLRGEQARLGAPVTGVLDKATLAALNVPVEARIATLEANLERERWMPQVLPPLRVEANIPAAQVEVVDGRRVVLAMRAIVGRPDAQTPMLQDVIEGAVFNPPWNVPTKVAQAQIWPKAKRDKTYLARNDYVVLPGGMIQQKPGPRSGLGKIKFEMTNPMAIYLHDTPSRDLFGKDNRALSNGCIRVERPFDLARLVLGRERGWDDGAIDAALASEETARAEIGAPVPVFAVYRTAFVQDGAVQFRKDLYGWDAKLLELLG